MPNSTSADRTTSAVAASPQRPQEPGSSALLAASELTPMTAPTAGGTADCLLHARARGGTPPKGDERDGGSAISSFPGGAVGVGSGSADDTSGDGASTAGVTRGGNTGCARGGGSGARGCGGGGPTGDGGGERGGLHVPLVRPQTRSRDERFAYALTAGGDVVVSGGERVDRLIASGVVLAVVGRTRLVDDALLEHLLSSPSASAVRYGGARDFTIPAPRDLTYLARSVLSDEWRAEAELLVAPFSQDPPVSWHPITAHLLVTPHSTGSRLGAHCDVASVDGALVAVHFPITAPSHACATELRAQPRRSSPGIAGPVVARVWGGLGRGYAFGALRWHSGSANSSSGPRVVLAVR